MAELIAFLFLAASVIGVLTLSTLLNAWALSKLWLWFAVPIFHLNALSYAQAMGIALLVGMLTHQYVKSSKSEEDSGGSFIAYLFVRPFLAVGIGYIVKAYI